jgi:hypothetical protein
MNFSFGSNINVSNYYKTNNNIKKNIKEEIIEEIDNIKIKFINGKKFKYCTTGQNFEVFFELDKNESKKFC